MSSQLTLKSTSPNQMISSPLATSSPLAPTSSLPSGPPALNLKLCESQLIPSLPSSVPPSVGVELSQSQLLAYHKLAGTAGGALLLPPGAGPAEPSCNLPPGCVPGYDPLLLQTLRTRAANVINTGKDMPLPMTSPMTAPHWPYGLIPYPYGEAMLGPYGLTPGYGYALDGARRKNATRETTSTLKAWLNEHKKNPYPTKGEKIMLAIITKMTLTQVSTWFANARRRLKKENKMTWEPRNRTEFDDGDSDAEDVSDDDVKQKTDHMVETTIPAQTMVSNLDRQKNYPDTHSRSSSPVCRGSDSDTSTDHLPAGPNNRSSSCSSEKPRIWSLAELASTSPHPQPTSVHPLVSHYHHQNLTIPPAALQHLMQPTSLAPSNGGKIRAGAIAGLHHSVHPYSRQGASGRGHSIARLLGPGGADTSTCSPTSSALVVDSGPASGCSSSEEEHLQNQNPNQ